KPEAFRKSGRRSRAQHSPELRICTALGQAPALLALWGQSLGRPPIGLGPIVVAAWPGQAPALHLLSPSAFNPIILPSPAITNHQSLIHRSSHRFFQAGVKAL